MEEIWKDIKDYKGYYQVSNLGNIKSLSRIVRSPLKKYPFVIRKGKKLKPYINKRNGYVYIQLNKENKNKLVRVHRLVAEAFIPNSDNRLQVNHKNGIKTDNKVSNLEWCTASENIKHAYRNGLNKPKKRRIIQMSKDNKMMTIWNSVQEASKGLKIERANITACCRERLKSAGGYCWRYLD